MFFYASIFIVSLISALIVLWLYKLATGLVYRTVLPGFKSGIARPGKKNLRTRGASARVPWGWKSTQTRTHPTASVAKAPWGWPGNTSAARSHDRPAKTGGAHNAFLRRQDTLNAFQNKTAMKSASKPWGW